MINNKNTGRRGLNLFFIGAKVREENCEIVQLGNFEIFSGWSNTSILKQYPFEKAAQLK